MPRVVTGEGEQVTLPEVAEEDIPVAAVAQDTLLEEGEEEDPLWPAASTIPP
jgi:hypothetical protein